MVSSHRSYLKGSKLWLYVSGDHPIPEQVDKETDFAYAIRIEDWECANHRIITWFRNTSIFSRYTWIYLFKNSFELYQIYRDFTKMIETQFSKPIKVFRSDNAQDIKPMNLPLFYINLVLFLIPLVQTLLSKMAGLSANFVIFLMLFVLLLLPLLLLLSFGGKLLLLPFTPSIDVLLPLFIIKLLMICCLVLLPPMTYLESLNVSVLFFFMIMKETNLSLVLVCVVFLGMELVKKVIGVMIPLANVFMFLGMRSFRNTKCFTNYLMFCFPYSLYRSSP